jgi:membrane protein implicated in regulation of membrane protease activity
MKPKQSALLAMATVAISLAAFPAMAYVGPGAGLTLLGALWGLILAVVVSIGFVLLWPLRRLMRRNKQSAGNQAADEDSTHSMLANPSGDRDDRRS